MRLFERWYSKAPFYLVYRDELSAILARPFETISDLNGALCRWIMEKLSIKTPIRLSSEYRPKGCKTERLIDLLGKAGATVYLSGPAAKNYLDTPLFFRNGLGLEYKRYDYDDYPQPWGKFVGDVTVLDLLFNVGPEARKYLKSRAANEIVASPGI
jgi:hypothetical protein